MFKKIVAFSMLMTLYASAQAENDLTTVLMYDISTKSKSIESFSLVSFDHPHTSGVTHRKQTNCYSDYNNKSYVNTGLETSFNYTILALSENKNLIQTMITVDITKKVGKGSLSVIKKSDNCEYVQGMTQTTRFNILRDFKLGKREVITLPDHDQLYITVLKQE